MNRFGWPGKEMHSLSQGQLNHTRGNRVSLLYARGVPKLVICRGNAKLMKCVVVRSFRANSVDQGVKEIWDPFAACDSLLQGARY
jgi:hypothetical protein